MHVASPRSRREDLLTEHYAETFPPTSHRDYLGKEHFWKLGEEAGYRRAQSGELFGELIFPTAGGILEIFKTLPVSVKKPKTFEPARFGLIVKQRSEIGFPYPPVPIHTCNPSLRQFVHNRIYSHDLNAEELVIQAGSFLRSITGRYDLAKITTLRTHEMIPQLGNVLLRYFDDSEFAN